jgi:hypothetical protein
MAIPSELALSEATCSWLERNNATVADIVAVVERGYRKWATDDDHPEFRTFIERRPRRGQSALVVEVDRSADLYKVINVYRDCCDRQHHSGNVTFKVVPELTLHARGRMRERHVSPSAIRDAMARGNAAPGREGATRHTISGSSGVDGELVVVADEVRIITVYYKTAPRFVFSRSIEGQSLYEQRVEGKKKDLRRERIIL